MVLWRALYGAVPDTQALAVGFAGGGAVIGAAIGEMGVEDASLACRPAHLPTYLHA